MQEDQQIRREDIQELAKVVDRLANTGCIMDRLAASINGLAERLDALIALLPERQPGLSRGQSSER